ncbi:MAG: hypothetical protein NT027_10135 [Proteobacteria bacterium]|nr:hypothetical protein [Pseudomonadota bacterium]
MKIEIPLKSKWPITSAALVSDTHNLQLNMRELIRHTGWRMDDQPSPAGKALEYLENGTSSLFIIEDSSTYSAYEALRTLASHPVGRLTPVLTLVHDTSITDIPVFEKVLHTAIARKPLTPNTFVPAFKGCLEQWESPLFTTLRKCGYAILNNQIDSATETLKKLLDIPAAIPYACPALIKIYVERNDWKTAESLIIDTIKAHPRMPSLLLTVADFYAAARMPSESMRFFKKLKAICNGSALFSFDIAQSALAMGHLDVAIDALSEWNKARPGNDMVVQNLAKLYISEGHEQSLEKLLHMNKSTIRRLSEQWDRAESGHLNHNVAS